MLKEEQKSNETDPLNPSQNNYEQKFYDREFDDIANNYDKEADHPLGSDESLASAEKNAESKSPAANLPGKQAESSFYNANSAKTNPFGANVNALLKNKKASGGILGVFLALIAGAIIGITSLGPLQFIHFSQLLHATHLSDQESMGNSRIKKLLIYAKTNDINKTRLGILANRHANKIDEKLGARGWSIDSTRVGNFDGFTYDPDDKRGNEVDRKARFTAEEMKAKLESEGIKKVTIENGKVKIPANQLKYWQNYSLISTVYSGNRDVGRITSAFEKRLLIKRSGITWNPVTKLDQKIKQSVSDFVKEQREKRLAGKAPATAAVAGEEVGEDATEEEKRRAADSSAAADEANKEIGNAKKTGKLALKGAAGVGILCAVKAVSESVDSTKQINAAIPLMQASAEVLGVGAKVMSGDDVSLSVLGEYSKSLSSAESSGGSSWGGARTIQYEQDGSVTGSKLPEELNPQPGSSELSKTLGSIPALDSVCNVLENTAVSIVVSLATGGGIVLTGITELFMQIAGPTIMSSIISLFTGEIPNLADPKYAGAVYGEAAMVGTRMVGNETASAMGGRVLTNDEELAIRDVVYSEKIAYNKDRSVIDKYLNPINYDTPVAKTIDVINPDSATDTIAKIPRSMIGSALSIFSNKAIAADTPAPSEVYYGIKKVGFSVNEIENQSYNNPYTNAEQARQILNSKSEYIDRLKECNKVEVLGLPDNLDFKSEEGTAESPAIISQTSLPDYCKNNDKDFETIRMAVFDTLKMKSLSCIEFDDTESCSEIMPTNASNDSPTPEIGDIGGTVQTRFGPFVFPVQASKQQIKKGGWCWDEQKTTCHGTESYGYYASDIMIKEGVPILSATAGKVVKVDQNKSNKAGTATEAIITIKANDCDDTGKKLTCIGEGSVFWYGHLKPNSAKVKVGDIVTAGQQIAVSGGSAQGDGVAHLHLDASDRKNDFRGSCARENMGSCAEIGFINIQPELYAAFNAIGKQNTGWVWPLGKNLKQGNCWNVQVGGLGYHAGMDINTDDISESNPAVAAHDGTVVKVGFDDAAGNYITIKSTDGIYYSYEHLSRTDVKNGDIVKANDPVGLVGKTGRVSAQSKGHLHFVTAKTNTLGAYSSGPQSTTVDPMNYLPKEAPNGYECLK